MKKSARRFPRKMIGIGATAVLVAALVVAVLNTEDDDQVVVAAMFSDASPLVEGNTVQMDGVPIGQISSLGRDAGAVRVEMKVEKSALPIRQDAKARIQVRSLLGERFVELDRGTPSAPEMDEPFTISREATERQVSLDELLDSVDDPTGTALAALVTTLGEGTAGEGKNIDAALKALEPAMRDTGKLGQVLGDQNEVLASLVDKLAPVSQSLAAGHGENLDRLVGSATETLSSVDSRRVALDSTLQHLPATLQQAQRTLNEVAGVAGGATGTLQDIKPLTQGLPEIKSELDNFTASAGPALTSLPEVLNHANGLLDQATPAVRDLRPGADALKKIGPQVEHLTTTVAPELETVLQFAKFWALANNHGDGLGQYFRAALSVTPKEILEIVDVPTGPGKGAAPAPPNAPGSAAGNQQQLPGLGAPGNQPTDAPSGQPAGPDPNSATGLTQGQEHTLLGQLLGGI